MQKLINLIAISLLVITVVTACVGHVSADDAAGKIEAAISSGNIKQAQSECERLFSHNPDLESMSVTDLCRLSIILADLAESSDENRDENAAQAVLCYRTAVHLDSIQAMNYYHSLGTEDYRHVYMLNQLLRPITDREDGVIYVSEEEIEWTDSVKQ